MNLPLYEILKAACERADEERKLLCRQVEEKIKAREEAERLEKLNKQKKGGKK